MTLGGSGASPGNLSQLFPIVHWVAEEVFSNQDNATTLNRCKLNMIDHIATGIWAAYTDSNLYSSIVSFLGHC